MADLGKAKKKGQIWFILKGILKEIPDILYTVPRAGNYEAYQKKIVANHLYIVSKKIHVHEESRSHVIQGKFLIFIFIKLHNNS